MTLTRESEALLAEVYGTTMALTVFPARLAAIEAAVRAEQAAEVERLRDILRRILPTDSIIDSCGKYELIEVGYAVEGWEARRWRAALAATPVAPAPAEPRP